jgi:hypothetical protein
MALLHVGKKRALKDAECKARGYCISDSYADYGFDEIPFTGDAKPDLKTRLVRALSRVGQTNNRLLWGMSSAGTTVREIRFSEGTLDGTVVLETRFPLGD